MAMARFKDVCIDASDGERMESFWAAVLGFDIVRKDGYNYLQEPGGGDFLLWVNVVPEPHTVKNRAHLDVHCAEVEDLLRLGATVVREPSDTDHWWSLADPEGGEFCAFVREVVPTNRLYEIVVDAADHLAQATWWQNVLGGDLETADDAGAHYSAIERVPGMAAEYLVFTTVPEPKTVKNRVHWDVFADDLGELVRRGARVLREPTEQDDWHVLADPEGNEFCVFARPVPADSAHH